MFFFKKKFSGLDVVFLMSIFRSYPEIKMSREQQFLQKFLISACFQWDARLYVMWVKNLNLAEPLNMGLALGVLFRLLKVLRLLAILKDAAGAERVYSAKGPGYCYMTGRGQSFCLFSHLSGLLLCLYVKLPLPSIFIFVDF